MINLFPKFQQNSKVIEQKLALFDSVRVVYARLVSYKSSDNMHYKNALLSVVVSTGIGPFAWLIYRTISSSGYLLSKVVTQIINVELTWENIWGGLPRKQRYDVLGEGDHELILEFWNMATTISPITKDVKRWCPWPNTWEKHPTHYLQESQVNSWLW